MTVHVEIRRRALLQGGAFLAPPSLAGQAAAQAWPARPIRMVLGYPPGGGGDATTRPLLPTLEKALGQPVVMDYRPGAAGTLAAGFVAKAPAAGYTLHMCDSGSISVAASYRNLGYTPDDFTYLGGAADLPLVLVAGPQFGPSTLRELVALARAQPGRLSYASSGPGGLPHLTGELLKARTGIFVVHIPYRGAAPALPDIMAGQVGYGFFTTASVIPLVRSKKLKALAVTWPTRLPQLADVPTSVEEGFPFLDASYRPALVAPWGLPTPVAERIGIALQDALRDPAVVRAYEASGFIVNAQSGEAVHRVFVDEWISWRQLITAARLNLQE